MLVHLFSSGLFTSQTAKPTILKQNISHRYVSYQTHIKANSTWLPDWTPSDFTCLFCSALTSLNKKAAALLGDLTLFGVGKQMHHLYQIKLCPAKEKICCESPRNFVGLECSPVKVLELAEERTSLFYQFSPRPIQVLMTAIKNMGNPQYNWISCLSQLKSNDWQFNSMQSYTTLNPLIDFSKFGLE